MNYTQPQIDRANAVSLEDFLRTQGETLIKSGREYRWKEHDSLTVRGNKWFRHSQSKETIDTYNTGESRGRETSHSLNYQKLGKELASMDELAVLDGGKCILQLRGVRPFLSDKYDITKHPNYKYLSDSDKRNAFDIERFLSVRLKPKAEEVYDVYEVDLTDEEAATA